MTFHPSFPGPASEPAVICLVYRGSRQREVVVCGGKKIRLPGGLIDHRTDRNGLVAAGRILERQIGLADVSRAWLFSLFHQPNRGERNGLQGIFDLTFALIWAIPVPDDWQPQPGPRQGEAHFVPVDSPEFPRLSGEEHELSAFAWRVFQETGRRPRLGARSVRPAVREVYRKGAPDNHPAPFTQYHSVVIAGRSDDPRRIAVSVAPHTDGKLLQLPRGRVADWEHDCLPATESVLSWHGLRLVTPESIGLVTVDHSFPETPDWHWGDPPVNGRRATVLWQAVVHPREEGRVNLCDLRWANVDELDPDRFVPWDRHLVAALKRERAMASCGGALSQGIF